MKTYLVSVAILFSLIGCQNETKVSADTNPCEELDAVDLEMLLLIEKIKSKYATNKKFVQAFDMEQVYWVQYRDRHLRALYPEDWSRFYRKEYGAELFNECKCKELARMTSLRVEELKLWISRPPQNQGECPSIWNEVQDK